MSTDPAAEHIDAVATYLVRDEVFMRPRSSRAVVRDILSSTDPAVHAALAASLPAEVMLAALVDRGALVENWLHRNASGGGTVVGSREEAENVERAYVADTRPRMDEPPAPASLGIFRRLVTPWQVAP